MPPLVPIVGVLVLGALAYRGLAGASRRQLVAAGKIVIPWNHLHNPVKAVGIGKGLRTKVNASIGTSSDRRRILVV